MITLPIRRDQLIVVDVEATCWPNNRIPPGAQSEIIEVGVCLLDLSSLQISKSQSILVRPVRSKVSAFCTDLTTLTQSQVDDGRTFDEACRILRDQYGSQSRAWGSWGNYDLKLFESQCRSFGVPYPFTQTHLNIKQMFGKRFNRGKLVGMSAALDILKLPLEGTHHRGGDDAYNIARIMAYMLDELGPDPLADLWEGHLTKAV